MEQNHRFIKKRVRSMVGLRYFRTATSIISGIEAIHMIKKRQFVLQDKSFRNQMKFLYQLFRKVAKEQIRLGIYVLPSRGLNLCTRTAFNDLRKEHLNKDLMNLLPLLQLIE